MIKNFPGRLLTAFFGFRLILDILIFLVLNIYRFKEQFNGEDFLVPWSHYSFNS